MERKPKALCIDLDDTILDFTGALLEVAATFNCLEFKREDLIDWGLPESLDKILNTHYKLIYAIEEPFDGVRETIQKAKAKGWKIIFLTARHLDSREPTDFCLRNSGLDLYDELIIDEDKVRAIQILSDDYDIEAFFDDKVDNVEQVLNSRLVPDVYLINRLHNKNNKVHKDIVRIDHIKDADILFEG